MLNGCTGKCVRLSRPLVGLRTHFKSLHFHFISTTDYSRQQRHITTTASMARITNSLYISNEQLHSCRQAVHCQTTQTSSSASFGQKWKTGTGRQYFKDTIGLSSAQPASVEYQQVGAAQACHCSRQHQLSRCAFRSGPDTIIPSTAV